MAGFMVPNVLRNVVFFAFTKHKLSKCDCVTATESQNQFCYLTFIIKPFHTCQGFRLGSYDVWKVAICQSVTGCFLASSFLGICGFNFKRDALEFRDYLYQ